MHLFDHRCLFSNIENFTSYNLNNIVAIGKWIDGRIIYRKCVQIGALPNNGAIYYPTNIPPTVTVVNLGGIFNRPYDKASFPINYTHAIRTNVEVIESALKISVQTDSDRSLITDNIVWIDYVL